MAILAIFYGAGLHREHYDTLRREIGWETQRPRGGVFHAASFDAQGDAHVVDIWESQEALDDFVSQRLMPAMQKNKIPAPKVDVYEVHNLNAYPGIDRFILK